MLKRALSLLAILFFFAIPAFSQTTTVTGTVKDLTGAVVTSGYVTFTLQPGVSTTIAGNAAFVPNVVTCGINGSGAIQNQALSGACVVSMNTSILPAGTYYKVTFQPYGVTSAVINFYAYLSSQDVTTTVPTPGTMPAYSFMDLATNQTIGGVKTFSAQPVFSAGITGSGNLGALLPGTGILGTQNSFSALQTFASANVGTLNSVVEATQMSGANIGAQINNAYAALPATGGRIHIAASGSCYNFTTPITMSTSGKVAVLEGDANGTCLHYTGTTGDAISVDWGASHLPGTIRNITLTGVGTTNSTTGIAVGPTANVDQFYLEGDNITGFGTGVGILSNSFNVTIDKSMVWANATNVLANVSEQVRIVNSNIAQATAVGLSLGGSGSYVNEVALVGDAFDDNQIGVSGFGAVSSYNSRFENVGQGPANYVNLAGGEWYEYGNRYLDDRATCTTNPYMVLISGAGQIYANFDHPFLFSSGCTTTTFISNTNTFGGMVSYSVNNQSSTDILANYTQSGGGQFRTIDESQNGDGPQNVILNVGKVQLLDPFGTNNPRYILSNADANTGDRILDESGTGASATLRLYKQAKGTDTNALFASWDTSGNLTNYGTGLFPGFATIAPSGTAIANCLLGGASGTPSPAACGSAATGKIAIPASQATYTVDLAAVTANSEIILQQIFDNSGIPSSPTCSTTATNPTQSSRTASTSFTFSLSSTPSVTCYQYWIIN